MNLVMNDALPRCTVPGSTCRLLQFEASGARPVWAVLDGAGARRFTGEVTLHLEPTVRAYFQDGELYFAERDGDASLAERLSNYGVVSAADLEAGTVRLGAIAHLGRLFDRVPTVDRDQVELALEVITGELLGEIADHTVTSTTVATYRHHASGVNKWVRKPIVMANPSADHPTTGEVPVTPIDLAELDRTIIADYEAAAHHVAPVAEPAAAEPAAAAAPAVFVGAAAPAVATPADATPADAFVIPEAPSYYSPPVAGFEPPAAAEPVVAAPVVEAPVVEAPVVEAPEVEAPGAITEQIWYRDPVLDPVVDARPASAPVAAPIEPAVATPRPAPIEFDLASVIEAVARENAGVPVPLDDDALVDDSVRAAVREALAEIEAATRPRVADSLSPMAFERALDVGVDGLGSPAPRADHVAPASSFTAGDADARPPAPWLPGRIDGTDEQFDESTDQADGAGESASDTPGTGLRRLIGGIRKP